MMAPSILFARLEDRAAAEAREPPAFFADLNLDQVVGSVTADWEEYNLKPFFFLPLRTIDDISYRQGVFRDLDDEDLLGQVRAFAQQMRVMREHLAQAEKLYYQAQKQAWFLDAVAIYCEAVKALAVSLSAGSVASQGLSTLRDYLSGYITSSRFISLADETKRLKRDLSAVDYSVLIEDNSFQVGRYLPALDYSADVENTFQKFQQCAAKDYKVKFSSWPNINHIEAKILDFVIQLQPDVFVHLTDYCVRNSTYLDQAVVAFDREVHFYIAYLQHAAKLKSAGLTFCYPRIACPDRKSVV